MKYVLPIALVALIGLAPDTLARGRRGVGCRGHGGCSTSAGCGSGGCGIPTGCGQSAYAMPYQTGSAPVPNFQPAELATTLATGAVAIQPSSDSGATDGIDEVNAARAVRGLYPYARDEGLSQAALAAASYRARYLIRGHVSGGMGDFQFLPPGVPCNVAGCGALEPSWGWGTCCTYDRRTYAGAAVCIGRDGRRYMHLYVR